MSQSLPPEEAKLERHLSLTRPKDTVLALMLGTIAAWLATNHFGYQRGTEGWVLDVPSAALAGGLAFVLAAAIGFRLIRNWRIGKFYKSN